MTANPADGFTLTRNDFSFAGHDLQRPECILAEPDGTLWTADARGGVVRIGPDGTQEVVTQTPADEELTAENAASRLYSGTLPNGLAEKSKTEPEGTRTMKLSRTLRHLIAAAALGAAALIVLPAPQAHAFPVVIVAGYAPPPIPVYDQPLIPGEFGGH